MAIEKTPRLGLPKYTSGSDLHPNRTEFNALQDLLEGQVAISAQGTLAERPSAGVKNRVYWATDTARAYFDDGKQWLDINPNGGGGAGKDIVVAGTAAEGTSARAARADHTHNLPLVTSTRDGAMRAADKALLDAATSSPTGGTLAKRTAAGHLDSPTPTLGQHVANKSYVDEQAGKKSDLGHTHSADDVNAGVLAPARLPAATQSEQGALSPADKKKLDSATGAATPLTLPMRNDAGQIMVGAPTSGTHAANKSYVDAEVAKRLEVKGDLGTGTINGVTEAGVYFQTAGAQVNPTNGYPVNGAAGSLLVLPFNGSTSGGWKIQEWTEWSSHRRWIRSTNDGGASWRDWTEQASTAPATTTADGLMPKADKALLDGATRDVVNSSLVRRDTAGRFMVADPGSGATDAANKGYVDKQVATRAPSSHSHPLSEIEVVTLGTQDLDTIDTRGLYHQNQNANTSAERNYPVNAAGLLEVHTNSTFVYQRYTSYKGNDRAFWRARYGGTWSAWIEVERAGHKHSGADITSGTIHPDRIANATASLDGLMPKADKALLDGATYLPTGGTLVRRHSTAGTIHVETGAGEKDAVNKGYVDTELAKKANSSHNHSGAQITSGTINPARIANATASLDGLMSSEDKTKLNAATQNGTANTLVLRNASGTANFSDPTYEANAATKKYVDNAKSDAITQAKNYTNDRGVKARWTDAYNEPTNSASLTEFTIAQITIPDPGYRWHALAMATVEASGGNTSTRWDVRLYLNGTLIDFSRGDIVAPWYKLSAGSGGPRTGALTFKLTAYKMFGSSAFGLSNYNRSFSVQLHPAHADE